MKVSVVIPCYNAEKFIERALTSVYNQTYNPIEVICVDNNSKDDTLSLLQNLKIKKYKDLIILSEKIKGAPAARNRGLSIASGEWVQFLDADDQLMANKIEAQIKLLSDSRCNNVGIIGGSWLETGLDKKKSVNQNFRNKWVSLFDGNIGNTCSVLLKRTAIEEVNGWDNNLESSQERDLFFRILKKNKEVLFLKEPLTIINKRPESITTTVENKKDNLIRFVDLKCKILIHLKAEEKMIYKENKSYFDQTIFSWLHILFRYNAEKATSSYYSLFSNKIDLQISSAVSKKYIIFYKIFGFYFTEKIYLFFKKKK